MKKVVVAVDGSEVSKGVVDYALHYADQEKDADLHFLHVIEPLVSEPQEQEVILYRWHALNITPSPEKAQKEFEALLEERVGASRKPRPSMSVSVRVGSAYARIVEFAEEIQADMIMIGHRGLGNLQRFFLGSVAAKVVAHAPCSVYVHRPKPGAK
mgnify:CR=1 FL=1